MKRRSRYASMFFVKKDLIIAGVDEAGRGPLAGPVIASAVILGCAKLDGLNDSKKLTDAKRQVLHKVITTDYDYGIGVCSASEVDKLGIKKATNLAMKRAVSQLKTKPDKLLIDGCDKFTFDTPSEDIIKGDEKEPCISAASVVAKVERDTYMKEIAKKYPKFGFESNKGYGSEKHRKLLEEGIYCEEHRTTYEPLKTFLTQHRLF